MLTTLLAAAVLLQAPQRAIAIDERLAADANLKVEERRRDVAALRLMGISRRTVMRSVIIEAALLALVGSALGIGVGWLGSLFVNWYYRGVYRTPVAFSIITPSIVTLAVTLSLVLGITAGILASLRLVRTPPLVLFGR